MGFLMAKEDKGGLVTVEQAMSALKCSRATIYKLRDAGKLEIVRITDRMTRVTERSLNKMIDDLIKQQREDRRTVESPNGQA